MPSVRLTELRKVFGAVVAVDGISIEFADGAMTSLLGPSGCGKTTTLNIIAGFEVPEGGAVYIGDVPVSDPANGIMVPPNRRNLGMVFQSYGLWPHLTVAENVGYGLKMRNISRGDRQSAVVDALRQVQLEAHLGRYPHELSGGQQQRVALARALVYSPSVLLLDEPLSNLDASLREEMRFELKELHRRTGITSIYVTHDQSEAMVLSDRIVVMNRGRIRQIGTPRQLYEEPADTFVASFIGSTNLLQADLLEKRDGWGLAQVADGPQLRCRCPGHARAGMRGLLSIRPEGIRLTPNTGGAARETSLTGRVSSSTYLGNVQEFTISWEGGPPLHVQQVGGAELKVDTPVALEIEAERTGFIVETLEGAHPDAGGEKAR